MARNYGNVKPHVKAAGEIIANRFNIDSLLGWYASTWGEHPKGLAIDFFAGKSTGDQLASYAKANAGQLNVMYIIWWRKIWSVQRASEGWRPYTGTANPHTDHVHVSFYEAGGMPTDPGGPVVERSGDWLNNPLAGLADVAKELGSGAEWITNPRNVQRIGMFILGLGLIVLALLRFVRL